MYIYDILTPRYFTTSTCCNCPCTVYGYLIGFFFLVILIISHLSGWNSIFAIISPISPACLNLSEEGLHPVYFLLPSKSLCHRQKTHRWLQTKGDIRHGPRTDPCGTPDITGTLLDDAPSTTTLCDLPLKNSLIQLLNQQWERMVKSGDKSVILLGDIYWEGCEII